MSNNTQVCLFIYVPTYNVSTLSQTSLAGTLASTGTVELQIVYVLVSFWSLHVVLNFVSVYVFKLIHCNFSLVLVVNKFKFEFEC